MHDMLQPPTTLAVQQLFVRHQSAIRAFIMSLVPKFSEADDVLQETFLTITEKAGQFAAGTNFLAWACTIARLKVLEAQRRGGKQILSPAVVDALVASMPAEALDDHRLSTLSDCFDRLPPRQRKAIELRYYRDQSPPQIAEQLSQTLNSVNVVLSKARAALRECVERALRRHEHPEEA